MVQKRDLVLEVSGKWNVIVQNLPTELLSWRRIQHIYMRLTPPPPNHLEATVSFKYGKSVYFHKKNV